MSTGIAFHKGHGTQNDFVLLPDPDDSLDLTASRVRALCDRARGIGADGVLRVVPDRERDSDDGWFMDYRNADGSIAEMCGNGVRLFARYLVDAGLVDGAEFTVGSRAGGRPVVVHTDGTVTVEMGPVQIVGESVATVAGRRFAGVAVDLGNPHLACEIDEADLTGLDLTARPEYDATLFPQGVNVEFVARHAAGLRMRVHERGVGETRSCGTGTVAAVAAALHTAGAATGESDVDILGGRVRVVVRADGSTLTGPAVFVASGELDRRWWDEAGTPDGGPV